MNKIKQNKITFSLILIAIVILFSSLTILSLPVLFNYESKVYKIEKKFYKNFKIYLNTGGKISYKPFPKPHLLVENATLNLLKNDYEYNFINTKNLKLFISLRDIYLRSFENIISTEISNTNLEFTINDILEIRKHLYEKINKQIKFINCKLFIRNKNSEVVLISPIEKITYKINTKSKTKNFFVNGNVFGIKYQSKWIRDFEFPKKSNHTINLFNPNVEVINNIEFVSKKKFTGFTKLKSGQENLEYSYRFNDNVININSPNKEDINFKIDSLINLNPFYFNGSIEIKNIKIENIIDKFLINLFLYDKSYLGNLNGIFKLNFNDLNNKLIQNGIIEFIDNEKKIDLQKARFDLSDIGELNSNLNFVEELNNIKFVSKNELIVKNHIEFAKVFQVSSKKAKKINNVQFDLEKNIGSSDFVISNFTINNINETNTKNKIFIIKNIQNLRASIREIID